jgi:hypothetical protein
MTNSETNNENYLLGRKKYFRPQAMLWSENPGELVNGVYIPEGLEINQDQGVEFDPNKLDQFMILSDDNREPINFNNNRIERRERMVNGRMRSFHIADKLEISTSWNNLPSRSFASSPEFDSSGRPTSLIDETFKTYGKTFKKNQEGEAVVDKPGTTVRRPVSPSGSPYFADQQYTTDGGAGGVELLEWYNSHQGPFWVYLSYDKYTNFNNAENPYGFLPKYSQVIEMFFSDFQYTVNSRGPSHDLWNISVVLEEV